MARRGIQAGDRRDGGGRYLVAYSGIAATVALVLLWVSPTFAYVRPPGLLAAATVVSVCLVVAAVALTLAAVPGEGGRAGVIALAGALVLGCASAGLQAMATTDAGIDADFVPWVAIPVLLVTCVVIVRGRPGPVGWLGYAVLGLVGAASADYFTVVGEIASSMLGFTLIPLTGDIAYWEAFHLTLAGLIAGMFLGLGTRFAAFWPGWRAALRLAPPTTQGAGR